MTYAYISLPPALRFGGQVGGRAGGQATFNIDSGQPPLQNHQKLFLVKLVHTIIWSFFVTVIGYVVYAGISGQIGPMVWAAIGLVILEGFVLLMNDGKCPLTDVGARYTSDRSDAFDIFLPIWLARHNKLIFTSIFAAGVLAVLYRVVF